MLAVLFVVVVLVSLPLCAVVMWAFDRQFVAQVQACQVARQLRLVNAVSVGVSADLVGSVDVGALVSARAKEIAASELEWLRWYNSSSAPDPTKRPPLVTPDTPWDETFVA